MITAIDPKTALIIIDLQNGLLNRNYIHSISNVLSNAALLAKVFRNHNLPVIITTVKDRPIGRTSQLPKIIMNDSSDWSDPAIELHSQPTDYLIKKQTPGAFTNTGLENYLRDRKITQLVLTGIVTSMGVESTARQAYEYNFNITLAVDAITDTDLDTHNNSVTKIFPRLGELGLTTQIIKYFR